MALMSADFFLFSYDGDDAPVPNASVSNNNALSSQMTSQQAFPIPKDEEPDTSYVPPAFEAVDVHSTNTRERDVQKGSASFGGGRGQDRDDVSMNNEPFGSGIKEDG
jgi:hypothetical protein